MQKIYILAAMLALSVCGAIAVSATPSAAAVFVGSANNDSASNVILVDFSDDEDEMYIRKAGENP